VADLSAMGRSHKELESEDNLKITNDQLTKSRYRKSGCQVCQSDAGRDEKIRAQKKASGKQPDAFLDHTINPSVN